MAERYKHPPLVELVAELRWGSGGAVATGQSPGANPIILATGQYEEFFMRFGSKVGAHGYDLIERIVPPGFPAMPFQAVYRFRQKQQTAGTTVYQVGAGVFSANITPPYQSWEQFRPVVEKGVTVLLETRNAPEHQQSFSNASLRYINAFSAKFTQGLSTAAFVRDILGFKIELPRHLRDEIAPEKDAKPFLQLAIPLASGQQMALMLAEGIVGGEQAVVMDIMVNTEAPIQPREADVMAAFDSSREVIHRLFVGATEKLSPIMEPIK